MAAAPNNQIAIVAPGRVAPPRITYSKNELVAEAIRTIEWQQMTHQAQQQGLDEENAESMAHLLMFNMRVTDDSWELSSTESKRIFKKAGFNASQAKEKVHSTLLRIRNMANIHQTDNNYFRVGPKGRLDNKHLCGVFIKRDGLNEILQSGNDPLSISIRTFTSSLVRLTERLLLKAQRFEHKHREDEAQRLASGTSFMQAIMEVSPVQVPAGMSAEDAARKQKRSAQGRLRKFAQSKYDTLGIVDKTQPGYTSAHTALLSAAPQTQLARRSNTLVSDNLTTVAKDADRYMNSAAESDIRRVQPQIDAAATVKQKRGILNNAINERVSRLKRFHVFHEDPQMVGVDSEQAGSQFDAPTQARIMLNQVNEKANFE